VGATETNFPKGRLNDDSFTQHREHERLVRRGIAAGAVNA
jgi:hypothetical protein